MLGYAIKLAHERPDGKKRSSENVSPQLPCAASGLLAITVNLKNDEEVQNEHAWICCRIIAWPNPEHIPGKARFRRIFFRNQRRNYAAISYPVGSGSGRVLEMQGEWGERSRMPFLWRARSLHNRWPSDHSLSEPRWSWPAGDEVKRRAHRLRPCDIPCVRSQMLEFLSSCKIIR